MVFNWDVTNEYDGKPLRQIMKDVFLMSNTMIKNVKLYGKLEVNGEHRRVIDTVRTGDSVFASYDDDAGDVRRSPEVPVLYEDQYIAVCVKPSDMVTHPTHGHLDDSLLTFLSERTLHPVMRLDRQTSGLIVIAKNGYIHDRMVRSPIEKKYIGINYGTYTPEEGIIDMPIKRREGSVMIRDCTTKDDPKGRDAVTRYKTILKLPEDDLSVVIYKLETGRCHQIRVHSLYSGHPLVGDGLYGPNSVDNPSSLFKDSKRLDASMGRQALHAMSLVFTHPVTNEEMRFISSIPSDMRSLLGSSADALDEILGDLK